MERTQLQYQAEKLKHQVEAMILELAETKDTLETIIRDIQTGQNRIDSREVIG